MRSGGVRPRHARARHLLRHAADGATRSAAGRAGARSASSATPRSASRRRRGAGDARCLPACRRRSASGPATATSSPRRRPGSRSSATSANAPVAAMADPDATACTRCCFIPRSCTPRAASRSSATSPTASAAAPATGRWRRSSTRRSARIRAQVGDGRVVCALSGGVDSTVAALHHPPRDRRPADVHLRRQRRAAARRGGADPQALRAAAAAARVRRRVGAVSRSPGRRRSIPSRSARSSARRSSTCSRQRPSKLGRGRLPRAGHALSGRHRVGVDRRAVGADQEPPQRRRPAGAHADEAGRAAARAVQGRSARGRAAARPRRGVRRAAAVSGPGPGGADPRRGDAADGSTCCAAPTRSWPRR